MRKPIGLLVLFVLVFGIPSRNLVADIRDGIEPHLVKDKFELPLNTDQLREQWKALGYLKCQYSSKSKGWTRGEHTHPWYILFVGITGEMEFIIKDQRFVLGPGDELYYPKDAVMTGKNLHDGQSTWFMCEKFS